MSADGMLRYATHVRGNASGDHLFTTVDEFASQLTDRWGQLCYLESYQGDGWLKPFFDHDHKFDSQEDALANGPEWYGRCKTAVLSLFDGILPEAPRAVYSSRAGRWVTEKRGAKFKLSLRTYLPDLMMRPMDLKSLILARCSSKDVDDLFDTSIYTARDSSHLLYAIGTRKEDTQEILRPVAFDTDSPIAIPHPFEPGFLKDYIVQSVAGNNKVELPEKMLAEAAATNRLRGAKGATTHSRFEKKQKAATTEQEQAAVEVMGEAAPRYAFRSTTGGSACFQKQGGEPAVCPYGETHINNNSVFVHFRPDGHMEAYCCAQDCVVQYDERPKLLGRWKSCAQPTPSPTLSNCNEELRRAMALVEAHGEGIKFYDGKLFVYLADTGLWTSDKVLVTSHLLRLANTTPGLMDVSGKNIRQSLQNIPSLVYSDRFLVDAHAASLNMLHYRNGMVDLDTFQLLPHHPKYGCTVSTNHHYLSREEVEEEYPGAIDKARKLIFEDPYTPNTRDEALIQQGIKVGREIGKRVGQAVTGKRERNFVWLVGVRGAAKGTTGHACDSAFGGYFATVDPSIYYLSNRQDPGAASPQLARLRMKRIWWTPEMKTAHTLDADFIKSIASSTDKQTARHLHEGTDEWHPQGKIFICGQDVNNMQPSDAAIYERGQVAEMKVSFLPHTDADYRPDNKWTKLCDDSVESWLSSPEGVHGFTHAVFDMLRLKREEGYKIQDTMAEEKKEWLGQHDVIRSVFGEGGAIERTADDKDKMTFKAINAILVDANHGRPLGMSAKAIGTRLRKLGLNKDEHSKYSCLKKRTQAIDEEAGFLM